MNFIEKMKTSANELKSTKNIVMVGMLISISLILGFFLTIQVGDFIQISFSFVANEMTSFLFGPFVGGIMGGISDILEFMIKSTGKFFPGFTISSILSGIIYGLVLYKNTITIKRVIIANIIVTVFINMFLNTYWLTILNNTGFSTIFFLRFIKQIILFPVEVFVFYMTSKTMEKMLGKNKINGI